MSKYTDHFRYQKESDRSNSGNGALTHCLNVISSVLSGGHKANMKATVDSELTKVKVMTPYGLASFPFKGMQAQVIYNENGNTIVGVYDDDRPTTKLGEVMLYNNKGSYVKIDKDDNIIVSSKTGKIKLLSGDQKHSVEMDSNGNITTALDTVNLHGNLNVSDGQFKVNGETIEDIVHRIVG